MIFVKGTELAREKDGIIVGVTEEEFAKSLLYYAVSTVGSDNLEGILKGLLSGNGINLNVDIAKAQSCGNAKCNCSEKKTKILEEVSLDNSEMFLSQEDGASNTSLEEVVPLSDVDVEMMRESLIEAGELSGEKEIIIPYEKSDIISVLSNNDEIQYRVLSSEVRNETKVIFSYSLSHALEDNYELSFTYVIIRRIK